MSLLNALGTAGLVTLAVVPFAILLLYFLKLRRRPVVVPSTMLWKRALEDMHVNSLWQRLRNNLLLWLQILAVLLLLLAGLRPGCRETSLLDNRFVFLVDVSASMSATDLPEGTRLDEAKRQLLATIDRMKTGDTAMIVAFSDTAEVVQSFTRDLQLLRRKAASIRQTMRRSDLTEALVAASGLANPGRTATEAGDVQVAAAQPATLMIFSDGGVREMPDFSLGNLTPEYHATGAVETPSNCAITAFSLGEAQSQVEGQQAFAQLYNGSVGDQTVDVSLYAGGELFDSQRGIPIAAARSTGISFDLTGLLAGLSQPMELVLRIETGDVLSADNAAHLVVNPPAPTRVLVVTPENEYLRMALTTSDIAKIAEVAFQPPEYLQSAEYRERAALGWYGLVLFDRVVPETMPACNTLFLDAVPALPGWGLGEKKFPTPVVDIDLGHPVMANLQLGGLLIVEGRAVSGPAGSLSLLDATYGSLISIAPREGFQDLAIGFPLLAVDATGQTTVNTNWPSQLSFPLFMQNAVGWMTGENLTSALSGTQPGQPVRLRAPSGAGSGTVVLPDGTRTSVPVDPDGFVQFGQTELTGVYEVVWSGPESLRPKFAVNLMDLNESTLRVRESLELGFEKVAAIRASRPSRREFWPWIVGLAIVVLAVEWYIYNRRVWI